MPDPQTKRSNKRNQGAVRALVISREELQKRAAPDREPSKEMSDDPFNELAHGGKIIEPPFDLLSLAMLREHSTELGQCIEAMEVNIEAFGYRFVPRVQMEKLDPKVKDDENLRTKVRAEHAYLVNTFTYACLDSSFVQFRRKQRVDFEQTGNAWMEVMRSADSDRDIQGFNHLPAYQMRLGRTEKVQQKVKQPVLKLNPDGSVSVDYIMVWRRFRMHVQSRAVQYRNLSFSDTYKLRWFKEFGDPRTYDCETGEEVTGDDLASFPEEKKASEVIHRHLYCTRSPYGLPRFIGNLLSIYGDRASEEINYLTFKNNNIPSMLVLVSDGQVTDGTIKRIEDFVESQIQSSQNYSKFLILEAESAEAEEGEDQGAVKLEVKPLVSEQHKDALFQEYSKNNQDKIRRSFRLPPLLVGRTDEYTRATVEASRKMADEQVFAPERGNFDDLINQRIFPEMKVVYHKFKSNSPNTTDNSELVRILAGAEKTGGMSPRIARVMIEDILGIELPDFPPGFDPDKPFSLMMAEAVKNKADPTEPGQQVTALKAVEMLTGVDPAFASMIADQLIEKLNDVEGKWREDVEKDAADHVHGHEEELDEL